MRRGAIKVLIEIHRQMAAHLLILGSGNIRIRSRSTRISHLTNQVKTCACSTTSSHLQQNRQPSTQTTTQQAWLSIRTRITIRAPIQISWASNTIPTTTASVGLTTLPLPPKNGLHIHNIKITKTLSNGCHLPTRLNHLEVANTARTRQLTNMTIATNRSRLPHTKWSQSRLQQKSGQQSSSHRVKRQHQSKRRSRW